MKCFYRSAGLCVLTYNLLLLVHFRIEYDLHKCSIIHSFSFAGDGTAPSIKSSWLQPETQYLVIQLNSKLSRGQYQLYTEFTGELDDDLAGFYRSEYVEEGVRK